MARRSTPAQPEPAKLSPEQIKTAILALERRIAEVKALDLNTLTEDDGDHKLQSLMQKINTTLRDIYGPNSIEFHEYEVSGFNAYNMVLNPFGDYDDSVRGRLPEIRKAVAGGLSSIETALEILKERAAPDDPASGNRILRAYEGLELHPEIARVASKRFQDGN